MAKDGERKGTWGLRCLCVCVLCREAAEAAGFHVLRLIHEPAAALLAYDIGQDCSSGRRYNSDA